MFFVLACWTEAGVWCPRSGNQGEQGRAHRSAAGVPGGTRWGWWSLGPDLVALVQTCYRDKGYKMAPLVFLIVLIQMLKSIQQRKTWMSMTCWLRTQRWCYCFGWVAQTTQGFVSEIKFLFISGLCQSWKWQHYKWHQGPRISCPNVSLHFIHILFILLEADAGLVLPKISYQ